MVHTGGTSGSTVTADGVIHRKGDAVDPALAGGAGRPNRHQIAPPPPAGTVDARTIRDKARDAARASGGRFLAGELEEQFRVARLLDRVFTENADDDIEWVLKGGMRQLAAGRMVGRHTRDADLMAMVPLEEAITSLKAAGRRPLGDGLEYRHAHTSYYDHHPNAAQVTFDVYANGRPIGTVDVDVSVDPRMTAAPRMIPTLDPLKMDLDRPAAGYRAYHPADQIADKVAATFERTPSGPSRRYRDLVDLKLLAETENIAAGELRHAIRVETEGRGMVMPASFKVPQGLGWENGYEAAADRVPELRYKGFDDGLATVKAFLDPILAGGVPADHRWDRARQVWAAAV
jgi:hypothetical protein